VEITAQVSHYPLGQGEYIEAIDETIRTLSRHGLQVSVQPLSTLVTGESEAVFAALREAFEKALASGATIMVVTLAGVGSERLGELVESGSRAAQEGQQKEAST
jgi:uncharacterized protein YqgV (UPF0045/DUF77 family)